MSALDRAPSRAFYIGRKHYPASTANRLRMRRAPKDQRRLWVMRVRTKWPIYIPSLNPPRIPRLIGRAMRLHLRFNGRMA